ncbi:MAG: rhodanese-like domain-containing protein [Caldilineaceae bacterium]|nr:rhodanese-like domain-containing protein [Caldilineaceae bacterium]
MYKYWKFLIILLIVLALGACGGGNKTEEPTAEADAPLAQEDTPTAEATATEAAPAEEAATEAPTEEPAAGDAAAMEEDVVISSVNDFLVNIPDGYLSVGNIDTFKDMLANTDVYLIDVREESEYAEGHIPGAVNIPIRTLADDLSKIPADQPVMVYCASGHRAAMSLASLQELGYTNAKAFPPGWRGWSGAEEEVSTEAVEPGSFDEPTVDPDTLAAVQNFLNNMPEGYYSLGSDAAALESAMDAGATVIDVRQPDEYDAGHVTDAINIPIRTLAENLDQIPADSPVIVYCASGHRAGMSLAALQTMGLNNVRSFPPGYGAWEAAQGEADTAAAEDAAAAEDTGTADAAVAEDVVISSVDDFLVNIPDGYLSVGNIDTFKDMLENSNVYLIDVREESEYAEGHIPGAVNIPIRTLADDLSKIPADQPVMVYCASGHRAAMSLASLQELGYTNAKAFPPGWRGWSDAEEEVSTEAVEPGSFDEPTVDPDTLAAVQNFLNNMPEGYYSLGSDPAALESAMDAGATVIDVRQPDEYDAGHVTDAINIPIRTLAENLDQIPADSPVIVYCASGHRAGMSLAALQTMGLNNVRSFPPGYGAWEAAQ